MVSLPLAGATAPVTLLGSVRAARGGILERHRHPSVGQAGRAHRLGRRTGHLRRSQGHDRRWAPWRPAMIDASYRRSEGAGSATTHRTSAQATPSWSTPQAGLESGVTAHDRRAAGHQHDLRPGMLNFLITISREKLVVDAEAIAHGESACWRAASRYAQTRSRTALFAGITSRAISSSRKARPAVCLHRSSTSLAQSSDRARSAVAAQGGLDAFRRASVRTRELLAAYRPARDGAGTGEGNCATMVRRPRAEGRYGAPRMSARLTSSRTGGPRGLPVTRMHVTSAWRPHSHGLRAAAVGILRADRHL